MTRRNKSSMPSFEKAEQHVADETGRVAGINRDNYAFKVQCFTVYREPRHPQDWSITLGPGENPYEWGAWAAYCREKDVMNVALAIDASFRQELLLDPAAALKLHWYFPAMLPSYFDADRLESVDQMAGEKFVAWIEKELERRDQLLTHFIETHRKETNPWD